MNTTNNTYVMTTTDGWVDSGHLTDNNDSGVQLDGHRWYERPTVAALVPYEEVDGVPRHGYVPSEFVYARCAECGDPRNADQHHASDGSRLGSANHSPRDHS